MVKKTENEVGVKDDGVEVKDDVLDFDIKTVIAKLKDFEREEVVKRLQQILDMRLENEFVISRGIKEGLLTEKLSVQDAVNLMNKCKDSIKQLVEAKQLAEGKDLSTKMINHIQIFRPEAYTVEETREMTQTDVRDEGMAA